MAIASPIEQSRLTGDSGARHDGHEGGSRCAERAVALAAKPSERDELGAGRSRGFAAAK